MRQNRAASILTAVIATGALAAPSFAAAPRQHHAEAAVFPLPEQAAARTVAAARDARRERLLRHGPVHPIVGEPDYGTAENAFGAARSGHTHAGQDVFVPSGTPLVAVSDGVIAEAGSDGEQGNYVYVYDEDEDRTYVYMHMVAPAKVKTGQQVHAGDPLGGVGCTGSCWGDHLHFEVRAGKGIAGEPQDPLPLLQGWPRAQG